jgi:hypothetical protein
MNLFPFSFSSPSSEAARDGLGRFYERKYINEFARDNRIVAGTTSLGSIVMQRL